MDSLSIIIPCYNAEKFILKNLKFIIKKLNYLKIKYEIILIDDGSTDRTRDKILFFSKKNKRIKLIVNQKNQGKSFSIIKSLVFCRFRYVIFIDADLPYKNYFNKVIYNLGKYDLVFIDRNAKKSKLIDKRKTAYQKLRFFISKIFRIIINFFLRNDKIVDTQAGLKGFKNTEEFKKKVFYSKYFFFDVELIAFFIKKKKKILSIPVKYSISSNSSIKLFSLKNFLLIYELVKVFFSIRLK
tara:strand:+ start:181 stop:903 length:723 start_codon:yes stop_codon:yes gene_type:complete